MKTIDYCKSLDDFISYDRKIFDQKRDEIHAALDDLSTGMIKSVDDEHRTDVFYMLCFCILVPQGKQSLVEKAIDDLKECDFLHNSMTVEEIKEVIQGKVRFHNAKARRLHGVRVTFNETDFWEELKKRFESFQRAQGKGVDRVLLRTRRWLIDKINGVGLKLASHFLRNIGMRGLAILDIHVLRALEVRLSLGLQWESHSGRKYRSLLRPLSKNEYYSIEGKMKKYAEQVGLGLDELDLLFWSAETGYVGK